MFNPIDVFGDEFKKRMENPFWGSFIISWLLINWKILYITLSFSSNKLDDKIIYIENLYNFGVVGFHNAYLLLFLYPIIASAFAVGIIPYFARFYLKAQVYHKEKDNFERKDWIENEKELLEAEKELIEEKKDVQSLKSEEDIWDEEYKNIEKSGAIPILVDFIFGSHGRRYDGNSRENISTYYFATLVTAGLMLEGEHRYELTQKGKYMIQKYPMDKLKEQLDPEVPF